MTRSIVAVVVACAVPALAVPAEDVVVRVDPGWTLEPQNAPFSLAPDGVAFAVYRYPGGDRTQPTAESRVVQVIDGAPHSTDFSGRVLMLEYAPDGSRLIVTRSLKGLHPNVRRATLLDPEGNVLWSRDDHRRIRFSTTGEVVYADGTVLEVFDLQGKTVRSVSFRDAPFHGAIVLGTGTDAIVALGRFVTRFAFVADGKTPVWEIAPALYDTEILWVLPLDPSRFLVRRKWGLSTIVATSGEIEYALDAWSVDLDELRMSWGAFARYRAFPGRSPDELWLFDGTSDALKLDLATGSIRPAPLDAAGPPGAVTRDSIGHGKLVLMSPTEVRLRSIP